MNTLAPCMAIISAVALCASPSIAQSATDALYACAEKSNAAERLECYDNAVANLRSAENSGDVVTFTTEEIAEDQTRNFGRAESAIERKVAAVSAVVPEDGPDEVTAGIISIETTRDGKLLVSLNNGQIWRQTDSTRVTVSKKSPPAEATVKKAALGSFRIKLGRARAFRAKRVD
ncbi:MAG: hypothetical protein AAGJ32_00295 [Pseudomonadota bacterium]